MEYLQDENEDVDMQALGPAGPDETIRLRDLQITEDETPAPSVPQAELPDIEMLDEPRTLADQQPPLPKSTVTDSTIEQALTESQIRGEGARPNIDDAQDVDDDRRAKRMDDEEEAGTDAEVEVKMRQWLSSRQPQTDAHHIWRMYESLTRDLSYALCEQLRLILEPTLATRLRGDYRTGKRLNMKKIIPYIASEFTKDKIWLRRTRPSQREYQVLVSLDDSKSMAESHSVHLAYETLALISKALSRLEVGDVAIARFGKTVEILHGFDEGTFSDAAGARVMGSFGFNQQATNVLALMEKSLEVLAEAREKRANSSTSGSALWQLQIIISDGICQSHDRLRSVLRKAEEQRVMVVFVIVDSLHQTTADPSTSSISTSDNSILSLKQATYRMVDGRGQVQMDRYLDTFPFEYYVVLRDVEALPDVLSGTLKQFFERSSEE